MNRKRSFIKPITALVLLVCIVTLSVSAFAGTSTERKSGGSSSNSELEKRLANVPVFKFWNHENGIGYGNCPVYTAPSTDAYRCLEGRASCNTNYYMSEGGYVGSWLLVRYQTNSGSVRVGYIPPQYIKGFQSKMGYKQFDYIPAVASGTIYVTDNPMVYGGSFAKMDAGEQFYVLARYDYYGDWWYIECTVDGQVARGFIDRASASFSVGWK